MAQQGHQPDIWLPPGTAVDRVTPKKLKGTPEARKPFEQFAKKLADIGFTCKFRHDKAERVVEILFEPLTDKTRQAVKVASQSSQATGLKTLVHYNALDDPRQAMLACIEKGLEELRQAL